MMIPQEWTTIPMMTTTMTTIMTRVTLTTRQEY
jgi:hypothetical protein